MSTTLGRDEILDRLQRMDNYDFEHFVADLWSLQGWETEVSQASIDAGVDVVATKEMPYQQKKLIQAKRYGPNTTVGGPDIQQYAALKQQEEGVDSAVVVTSNRFSSHALDRAEELNVKTVDGEGLVDLIERHDAHDLINKYGTTTTRTASTGSVAADSVAADSSDAKRSRRSRIFWKVTNATARISPDGHYRIIQVSVITWLFLFVLAATGYTSGDGPLLTLYGFVWLVSWFLHPSAIYHEGTRTAEETDWSPRYKRYIYGAVIPYVSPFAGIYYLYRRKQAYENTDTAVSSDESGAIPETGDTELATEQSE